MVGVHTLSSTSRIGALEDMWAGTKLARKQADYETKSAYTDLAEPMGGSNRLRFNEVIRRRVRDSCTVKHRGFRGGDVEAASKAEPQSLHPIQPLRSQ